MEENMKKAVALFFALLLVISMVVSCQTEVDNPKDSTTTDSTTIGGGETTSLESTDNPMGIYDTFEKRQAVSDGLGEYSFDGQEFRILTADWHTNHYVIDSEDTTDKVNAAIYNRNLTVEDRFDCTIKVAKEVHHDDLQKTLEGDIFSGECNYDFCAAHAFTLGSISQNDYFMNWYDVPNVNFDKPWWSNSTIEDLTYKGVCLLAESDLSISAIRSTWCVYYNKELGKDYRITDNLYEVVADNRFTIDYLGELTKDIYEDLDRDGTTNEQDFYGYVSGNGSALTTFTWAFDNPIFKKDGDILEYVYPTEKIVDIIETLRHYFLDTEGITCGTTYNEIYGLQKFAQSQAVFANADLSDSLGAFSEMKDYAILPYPMYDEAQGRYYTVVGGGHDILAVPKSVVEAGHLEFVGTIAEALSAESFKQVTLVYYEEALKQRGTRDEESFKTLDLILNSRIIDFGFIYDGWQGASTMLGGFIVNPYTEFATVYAEKETQIMTRYNTIIEFYESLSQNS